MRFLRIVLAYAAAVAATTALGAIIQTQSNLAALQALGTPIPSGVRLDATAYDLIGFSPNFAPIVAAGFLIAFLLGALVLRWRPAWRTPLYALGGAIAIATALVVMQWLLSITAIAATRGAAGFACFVLAGAFGGWLFARLGGRPDPVTIKR